METMVFFENIFLYSLKSCIMVSISKNRVIMEEIK